MQIDTLTFFIGIASFIGAIVGAALSNLVTARLAAQERKEARHKEWLMHLQNALQSLIKERGEYEELISANPKEYTDYSRVHAGVIGRAISTILSVDDDELRYLAIQQLTPNMVTEKDNPDEVKHWGDYKTRNRNGLTEAVIRLGKLISKEMNHSL
ncbi:MAG: hypothetical protein ABI947_03710 [Chloroflexota bacterium]